MDLTAAEVRGFAFSKIAKTGNPEFLCENPPAVQESPFLASSEITSPAVELRAVAISLAAAKTLSTISKVVLIIAPSHLMQ